MTQRIVGKESLVSGNEHIDKVISIDRDFYIYRKNNKQALDNLYAG
ncbi:hypothetical protein [Coraliomargarita parva]|nr:hypothetical protein [Coraliomargarita parva]